jgi:tetratricopeptide (TPR) repeat protein
VESLPLFLRKDIDDVVGQLKSLTRSKDDRAARRSLELLAGLRSIFGQTEEARAFLSQAVERFPSEDRLWDSLLVLTLRDGLLQKGLEVAEAWLKHNPSPRNHLLVANMQCGLEDLGKAEQTVRAGLRLSPKDAALNVALAAVLLKSNGNKDSEAVKRLLDRAEDLMSKSPGRSLLIDWTITRCVYLVLEGEIDLARSRLRQVIRDNPDSERAKEMLKLLGG